MALRLYLASAAPRRILLLPRAAPLSFSGGIRRASHAPPAASSGPTWRLTRAPASARRVELGLAGNSPQQSTLPMLSRHYQTAVEQLRKEEKADMTWVASSESMRNLFFWMNVETQSYRRVKKYMLDAVFAALHIKENDRFVPDKEQALFLLRCFGDLSMDERPKDRTRRALFFWNYLKERNFGFEVSHFNALLRCHVVNEHNFSTTEFLAWMVENEVEPNRLTFQNIIKKFCYDGDMDGAKTILEHMKQSNMSISEDIFHAFIVGHCIKGDFESAKSMFGIIGDSKMVVTGDTYLWYLIGMVRGGKPWAEVKAQLEEYKASHETEVISEDQSLLVELVRRNDLAAAEDLVESISFTGNHYRGLYSTLQQLFNLNQADMALKIMSRIPFKNFQYIEKQGKSFHQTRGLSILDPILTNEVDPEKLVGVFDQLNEYFLLGDAIAHLVEEAILCNKGKYAAALKSFVVEKYGSQHIPNICSPNLIQVSAELCCHRNGLVRLFKTLQSARLRAPQSAITNIICPKITALYGNPIRFLQDVRMLPIFPPRIFVNGILAQLLNNSSREQYYKAAAVVRNYSKSTIPSLWVKNLVHAFKAHEDPVPLIAIYFWVMVESKDYSANYRGDYQTQLSEMFLMINPATLSSEKPNDASGLFINLLDELIAADLGMPKVIADSLKDKYSAEDSQLLEERLTKMVELFDNMDAIWTVQKRESVSRSIGVKVLEVADEKWVDLTDINSSLEDCKGDLNKLERLYNLAKEKKLPGKVISALLDAYNLQHRFTDAARVSLDLPKAFHVEKRLLRSTLAGLVSNEQLELATKLLLSALHAPISLSSLVTVLDGLAKSDKHDEFSAVVQELNTELVENHYPVHKNPKYRDMLPDDPENRALISKLKRLNLWLNEPEWVSQVHEGDIDLAIEMFEKQAQEEKSVRMRHVLMRKLIELEDLAKMQRVLDASIDVLGEERSLYDLAADFLHMGRYSQAKKILSTPGLRYNKSKVDVIMDICIPRNATALENFVKYMHPVFACNRDYVYMKLVDKVDRDPQRLENVWLNIQEEGHMPSAELKEKIMDAFQRAGLQEPK